MSKNFKIPCSLKRTSVWESKETLEVILIIFFCKIKTRLKLLWYVDPHTETHILSKDKLDCSTNNVGKFWEGKNLTCSLNLSRIQILIGTSVTNYNNKHGLMLTCRHDVDVFTWGRIVLSLPKRANVDWKWPISREKYLKIDWSVKMPLHWLIMKVAGS